MIQNKIKETINPPIKYAHAFQSLKSKNLYIGFYKKLKLIAIIVKMIFITNKILKCLMTNGTWFIMKNSISKQDKGRVWFKIYESYLSSFSSKKSFDYKIKIQNVIVDINCITNDIWNKIINHFHPDKNLY